MRLVNEANRLARVLHKQLVPIFQPLLGKRIFKADGSLLAKYDPGILNFGDNSGGVCPIHYQVAHEKYTYRLVWKIKVSTGNVFDSRWEYYTTSVCLGSVENGVLTNVYDKAPDETKYTVEEILALQDKIDEAKDAYDKARGLMPYAFLP